MVTVTSTAALECAVLASAACKLTAVQALRAVLVMLKVGSSSNTNRAAEAVCVVATVGKQHGHLHFASSSIVVQRQPQGNCASDNILTTTTTFACEDVLEWLTCSNNVYWYGWCRHLEHFFSVSDNCLFLPAGPNLCKPSTLVQAIHPFARTPQVHTCPPGLIGLPQLLPHILLPCPPANPTY